MKGNVTKSLKQANGNPKRSLRKVAKFLNIQSISHETLRFAKAAKNNILISFDIFTRSKRMGKIIEGEFYVKIFRLTAELRSK